RVLDLPAAPVLPDDPERVPRRRAHGRLWGVPDHDPGDRAPGQAGDRGGRAVQLPAVLERLLRPAPVHAPGPGALDAVGGALTVQEPVFGPVEPGHGRHVRVHGAGHPAVLLRPEGVRRRRDADGGEGMKLAVIGAGSTYTPELVSGLARERERIDVRELVLHDIDPERRSVVGALAG